MSSITYLHVVLYVGFLARSFPAAYTTDSLHHLAGFPGISGCKLGLTVYYLIHIVTHCAAAANASRLVINYLSLLSRRLVLTTSRAATTSTTTTTKNQRKSQKNRRKETNGPTIRIIF
ncbi:hypothetical protein F4823DRAFT_292263 [Ustulina deusta]|nr:hypothetical protein F4823DRAFT_292263 [Ustulina deusta]